MLRTRHLKPEQYACLSLDRLGLNEKAQRFRWAFDLELRKALADQYFATIGAAPQLKW